WEPRVLNADQTVQRSKCLCYICYRDASVVKLVDGREGLERFRGKGREEGARLTFRQDSVLVLVSEEHQDHRHVP
ncbi:MAG: hypothetical protein ACK55I_36800, partial [bacterium]